MFENIKFKQLVEFWVFGGNIESIEENTNVKQAAVQTAEVTDQQKGGNTNENS